MKFLHIADLHLGRNLLEFDLMEDQKYILNQIIAIAKDTGADGILIAGDVYDRAVPSEAAMNLLDCFLTELAAADINVYMISGNHDSDDRLNYGSSFFRANHIFISSVFDGQLHRESITDGNVTADIYMLPFVKASQVRHYFPDEEIENYDDAVRVIIKNTEINKEHTNILLAHQFVTGRSSDPVMAGSEGVGTLSVGLVEKVSSDVFDDFDYAALGHIHSPQKCSREEVRYSGSPLKYSLNEVNNEKSVPVITVSENGKPEIELIPLNPMRDMRHLKGKLADLLDKGNVTDTNDFIYATLTNEDIINDAMGIFRQIYPNTVHIDYDNSHTKAAVLADTFVTAENKTFTELISDFYQMIYGCTMTEEEMKIMKEAASEAGVINEAD